MPLFVNQRSLYEVRERPSKAYSWKAFLLANIVVEIPYNIILAVLVFGSYYYAVEGIQPSLRQGMVLLFLIEFFIYAGTFAHLCIVAMPDAQTVCTKISQTQQLSAVFRTLFSETKSLLHCRVLFRIEWSSVESLLSLAMRQTLNGGLQLSEYHSAT
ncbi:unnamed protein product [Aureobasidium mustum]|uniref:ABC-2 type transporter transmembrane domain-containing protein n=1 Tax=Aureobasidium mustum TaxID=2773714 RepID=A0A9N8KCE2_9PEZI|nr:unnamed protein product [Aureobasidium mustum]